MSNKVFKNPKLRAERISRSLTGKKLSEEHKRNLSKSHKGKSLRNFGSFLKGTIPWNKGKKGTMPIPWNKGKKGIYTEETIRKISEAGIGRKHSEATKIRIGKAQMGEKNVNWKGGITPENHQIRTSIKYKLWRKVVFERDNYACVLCGDRQAVGHKVVLQVDHIKPFCDYPELRFAIDNGRTLCIPCHRTTETFSRKSAIL